MIPARVPPRSPIRPLAFGLGLALLAACAGPPDFGPSPSGGPGPWPRLVPLGGILAEAEASRISDAEVASLLARAAALRARAARLRKMQVGT